MKEMFKGRELFVEDDFRRADAVEGESIVDARVGSDEMSKRRLRQRLRQMQVFPFQVSRLRIDVLMFNQVVHDESSLFRWRGWGGLLVRTSDSGSE